MIVWVWIDHLTEMSQLASGSFVVVEDVGVHQ